MRPEILWSDYSRRCELRHGSDGQYRLELYVNDRLTIHESAQTPSAAKRTATEWATALRSMPLRADLRPSKARLAS